MAPSTPPPPKRLRLAALAMASTSKVVMSATMTSSRAAPTSAVSRDLLMGIFRGGLGGRIHRAVRSDSIKMRREEPSCRLAPALMQRLEKLVIVVQAAAGIGPFGDLVEHDAMQPQAPRTLFRHTVKDGEAAQFRQQRGVKGDLCGATDNLARGCGRPVAP